MFTSQTAFRSEDLVIYHIPFHSSPVKAIGRTSRASLNTLFTTRHHPQTQNSFTLGKHCPLGPSGELEFRRRTCQGTEFQMPKDLKMYKAVKPDGTWKNWGRMCLAEHFWPVKPDNPQNPLMEDLGVKPSRRCWQRELLPHTRGSPESPRAHAKHTGSDLVPQHLPWAKPALYFSWATQKHGVFMIPALYQTWLKSALDPRTEGEALCRQFLLQGSAPVPGSRPGMHMHLAGSSKSSERTFQGFFQLIV